MEIYIWIVYIDIHIVALGTLYIAYYSTNAQRTIFTYSRAATEWTKIRKRKNSSSILNNIVRKTCFQCFLFAIRSQWEDAIDRNILHIYYRPIQFLLPFNIPFWLSKYLFRRDDNGCLCACMRVFGDMIFRNKREGGNLNSGFDYCWKYQCFT